MLTNQQGQVLVRLARQTIEKQLGLNPSVLVSPEELNDPALQQQRAVFVTLNKRGQLRGCIGSLAGTESILDGVRRHAINAAFHDHRFTPVTATELEDVTIDISVLTEPEPLVFDSGDELTRLLRPGIDGVILSDAYGASATFLPQVWEQLPTVELFLGHLCRKAGLPENFWRTGNPRIQTYQVQYFNEA